MSCLAPSIVPKLRTTAGILGPGERYYYPCVRQIGDSYTSVSDQLTDHVDAKTYMLNDRRMGYPYMLHALMS